MKFPSGGAAILLSCWVCYVAEATVDILYAQRTPEEGLRLGGRRLVQTTRGLWLENHHIAIGENQTICDSLRSKILNWRTENTVHSFRAPKSVEVELNAVSIKVRCYLPFYGSEDLVSFVKAQEGVLEVDLDLVVTASQEDPLNWGLNRIDQRNLPLSKGVPFEPAFNGTGVNIYVIDSGVNDGHIEFLVKDGSRASMAHSEILGESLTDLYGHGTHCAGTAGGSTVGVAPGATILGVKVLDKFGDGSITSVINGIKWSVENQNAKFGGLPAVFSLSLGGGRSTVMESAVKDAAEAGNIVIVAAGNDADNACNHSPASTGGKGRRGGVISVGATTASDSRADFSNYGNCVDIFAPGKNIYSTWIGSSNSFNIISGTSMATPHVAGAAAVLLQKNGMDKAAAQAEIFSLAVKRKVKNSRSKNNFLLQVPVYTGPPTPAPTRPPTFPDPTLCSENKCFPFAQSDFGPRVLSGGPIFSGQLAVTDMLCQKTKENFRGKIVLVKRGVCTFTQKVENAQEQGAVAVVIYMTTPDPLIIPGYVDNYNVGIPSCMVSLESSKTLKKLVGKQIVYGSVI